MHRLPVWLLILATVLAACSTDAVAQQPDTAANPATPLSTLLGSTALGSTAQTQTPPPSPEAPTFRGELGYEIVAIYPHLTTSFTQGLEFLDNGQLLEGLGRTGESGRAIVDLESGEHLAFEPLDSDLFGEGITQVGDELFQLTWVTGTVVISDSESLAEIRRYSYDGQGWGLCWNGTELAMSNGSTSLTFRDPSDFSVIRRLSVVSDHRELIGEFNELECVGNQIWANLYQRNTIVAINAESGEIEAWLDLSAIEPELIDGDNVLNGIAYRPATDTFFVAGKRWAEMYELRLTQS